jgi:hypothetical protein
MTARRFVAHFSFLEARKLPGSSFVTNPVLREGHTLGVPPAFASGPRMCQAAGRRAGEKPANTFRTFRTFRTKLAQFFYFSLMGNLDLWVKMAKTL